MATKVTYTPATYANGTTGNREKVLIRLAEAVNALIDESILAPSSGVSTLDDITASGVYKIVRGNMNTLYGINSTCLVLHMRYNDANGVQIAAALQLDGIYFRQRLSGTWAAWKSITLT